MDDVLIEIDPDACVGYGECVAEDGAAVRLDEHGCARVVVARLEARAGAAALRRVSRRRDPARR